MHPAIGAPMHACMRHTCAGTAVPGRAGHVAEPGGPARGTRAAVVPWRRVQLTRRDRDRGRRPAARDCPAARPASRPAAWRHWSGIADGVAAARLAAPPGRGRAAAAAGPVLPCRRIGQQLGRQRRQLRRAGGRRAGAQHAAARGVVIATQPCGQAVGANMRAVGRRG
eukprot:223524-Chlamydomonas_euryale.AAC.1